MDDQMKIDHERGTTILGPNTLVVALDETGHEEFADPKYPVFGLGGCAFMVRDYSRLVAIPWNYMCETFFPKVERPMHASRLPSPSEEQLEALAHFFRRFEFFRLATTVKSGAKIDVDLPLLDLVGKSMQKRIAQIASQTTFDRLVVILEESQRSGVKIIRSLRGELRKQNGKSMDIEMFTMPKSACEPMLEVADFIMHAAGTQTRVRETREDARKDFELVFRSVDERLTSFYEIYGAFEV